MVPGPAVCQQVKGSGLDMGFFRADQKQPHEAQACLCVHAVSSSAVSHPLSNSLFLS